MSGGFDEVSASEAKASEPFEKFDENALEGETLKNHCTTSLACRSGIRIILSGSQFCFAREMLHNESMLPTKNRNSVQSSCSFSSGRFGFESDAPESNAQPLDKGQSASEIKCLI